MRLSLVLFLAAALAVPSAEAALDPSRAAAAYAQLQKWSFSAQPIALPAGGVTFSRDTATWTLHSGSVRLMQPLEDGSVTGLLFEGQGRFRMTIPDKVELAQLRRFAAKPDLTAIDEPFTQLVLRVSDDTVRKLVPAAAEGTYAPNGLAQKRHEQWLANLRQDVDAQIVMALLNPGAVRWTADMNTAGFDWLTWDYDSAAQEEITLTRLRADIPEVWVSLDRPEDRTPEGRPGLRDATPARLAHLDLKADLTRTGRTGEVGTQHQRTINGHYVIDETLEGLVGGVRALAMFVPATAQELTVRVDGQPATFFRDHIGARSAMIDNKVWDSLVTIVLPSPLAPGAQRHLQFEYDLETANYALGGNTYPLVAGASAEQKHTARLELTVGRRNEVRAMGRMESRREQGGSETSVWLVERPTKMVTFSTATRFEEVKVDAGSIPPVVSFGPSFQIGNTNKVRNVAADVANSLQFFQVMLQDEIEDTPQFYVTSIAAGHGQAFEGFLHMSEYTYSGEHPGASELFRAHEVAHEWFGHKVGFRTYRDQWLSEAFAEYAAMMFVQSFVKGGPAFFDEILDAYEGIVMGNLKGGFSKFSRPWLIELNPSYRARLGPIGHGYRAATADIPAGYQIQTYVKGPLVLHMLRTMLRYRSGSDDLFVKILRDFVHDYSGKSASTADFRSVVERDAPGDWSFFFDQWIDRADIPTFRWSYQVSPAPDGGYAVTVNLKRSGVPDDVRIIVPVKVEYEDGRQGVFFVSSRKPEESVTRKASARPKNVILGPDHSLLATIRRD